MTGHNATKVVHAGEPRRKPHGAITTPIIQSSTYTFVDSNEIFEYMQSKVDGGRPSRDEYGRYGNPTQRVVEEKLASIEGGDRALLFPSGMCAISTTMLALLSAGDHVVLIRETSIPHRCRYAVANSRVR